jgi:hypothetical protein
MNNPTEADMCERYKNWVQTLAMYVRITFHVGKELGGETYIKRLEEEFFKWGANGTKYWKEKAGLKENEKDCLAIGKLMDTMDDSFANWWEPIAYLPERFEKKVITCPVAKFWEKEPDICTRLVPATLRGLCATFNPEMTGEVFEVLSAGAKSCHYRIEIKKNKK